MQTQQKTAPTTAAISKGTSTTPSFTLSDFGPAELSTRVDPASPPVLERLKKSEALLGDFFGQVSGRIQELETSGAANRIKAGITKEGVMFELERVIRCEPEKWLQGNDFIGKLYSQLKAHIQREENLSGAALEEATVAALPSQAYSLLMARAHLINDPDMQRLMGIAQQRLVVEAAILSMEEKLGNGYRLIFIPQEPSLSFMTHPENSSAMFVGGAALKMIGDAFLGDRALVANVPYLPPNSDTSKVKFEYSVVPARTLVIQTFAHEFQHCAQSNETRAAVEFPDQALAGLETESKLREIPEGAQITTRIQHIADSVWHELLAYGAVGPTEVSVGDGMLKSVAPKFLRLDEECPAQAKASGISEIAADLRAPSPDTALRVTKWAQKWLSTPLSERLALCDEVS
jgi:hypothetical protein